MTSGAGDRVVDGAYQAFGDRSTDTLFSLFTALVTELWTVRDRQRLTEAVLEQHGIDVRAALETLHSTPEDIARMTADRDAFIERVFAGLAADVARSTQAPAPAR